MRKPESANTALTDAFGPHEDDKAAAIAADDAARESAETRGGVVIETPRPTTADDSMQALTNIFRAKAKKPPEGTHMPGQ